jgi:hypothetical protein
MVKRSRTGAKRERFLTAESMQRHRKGSDPDWVRCEPHVIRHEARILRRYWLLVFLGGLDRSENVDQPSIRFPKEDDGFQNPTRID